MKVDHIQTEQVADGVNISTDDRELFDYIEDFVIERGFEPQSVSHEERNGRCIYVLHFGPDASKDELDAILSAIPEAEIERIWGLNN